MKKENRRTSPRYLGIFGVTAYFIVGFPMIYACFLCLMFLAGGGTGKLISTVCSAPLVIYISLPASIFSQTFADGAVALNSWGDILVGVIAYIIISALIAIPVYMVKRYVAKNRNS
jgi:hypothetical protein